jgi:hypothetical protein
MKLLHPAASLPQGDPRSRLVADVQTELYRLTLVVDELKTTGTVAQLDAAQKILWGVIQILDGRQT